MGQHQLGNFLVLRVGNSVFIFIHGFEKKRRGGGGCWRFWYFIVFDRMLVCHHQSYHDLDSVNAECHLVFLFYFNMLCQVSFIEILNYNYSAGCYLFIYLSLIDCNFS